MVHNLFVGIRDIIGRRAGAYENELRKAKKMAINEMVDETKKLGANAVLGVGLDYETIGQSML